MWVAAAACVTLVACGDSTSPKKDPNAGSPDLSTLPLGASRVLTFEQAASGLTIPASLSTAEYAIVATNITPSATPYSYTFSGSWQTTTQPQFSVSQSTGPSSNPFTVQENLDGLAAEQFESRLRARERALARSSPRGRPSWRRELVFGTGGTTPTVGTKFTVRVGGTQGNGCDIFATTTAIVRRVSDHAVFAVDSALTSDFSNTQWDSIVQDFESVIYPTDVSYFGTPSDVDNNSRVVIYYTPEVNKLTEPGAAGVIGGFFFAGDLFPVAQCAASNEGEIFYLLAPDPTGSFSSPTTASQVFSVTRGTTAHEFQHMINAGNRKFKSNGLFESSWLDEGLAHFAEDAVGRVALGVGDLHQVVLAELQQNVSVANAFFVQNLIRSKIYLSSPDTAAPISSDAHVAQSLAHRGAAWSLLRFGADWYSQDNPRALTRKLAMGPDTGTTNFTKQLGVPLDSVLSHWLLALYTDGSGFTGVPANFSYRSYAWRPTITNIGGAGHPIGTYGLPFTTLGSGATSVTATFPATSGAYFVAAQSSGARTIQVSPTVGAGTRLYILRIK